MPSSGACGGVAGGVASFTSVRLHEDAPPAPPPAAITYVGSTQSDCVRLGELSITDEGRKFAPNYIHVEADDVCDDEDAEYSDDGDTSVDGEASLTVSPCVPTQGCGRPPMGLGRSSAIALLVCAFCCVCATAAPLPVAMFGGASIDGHTDPTVGGAGSVGTMATMDSALTPTTPSIDDMNFGVLSSDAIPPRRER
ncbi:hypothetical protein CYMTET_30664 [Cymbomonas tetramitiformis]|uniref:Uncharacterized protein n=1 Tax=Cymbomonas tetramitiformis TaxID=36881 RepID=A0AAE0FIM7_9CHLO|nr:hypothetical protein CYMTET_30664 [Cymbomonas tetramitiformis]